MYVFKLLSSLLVSLLLPVVLFIHVRFGLTGFSCCCDPWSNKVIESDKETKTIKKERS